jgi:hypothetical protein
MNQEMSLSVLFGKVQQGDRQSLATLTTRVRDKVYVYLYRLTLDHHTVVDHEKLAQLEDRNQDTTIIPAQRREMIEAITQSPNALKLTYRNVLTLRCYDQLAYAGTPARPAVPRCRHACPFFKPNRLSGAHCPVAASKGIRCRRR